MRCARVSHNRDVPERIARFTLVLRALRLRSALLALVAVGACLATNAHATADAPPRTVRVLFVGNSYIYTNALPSVVSVVAQTRGILLIPGMLAQPDFALEDHIVTGAYQRMLESEDWDWVVLQQGPSSLPENRAHLRTWAGIAAEAAHARGIQVALMSAWPALGNAHTWLNAELSYREAAVAAHGCVLPVATAWRFVRAALPAMPLYQVDGLHPVPEGTLLAALTIVRGMFARTDPPGPPDMEGELDDPQWRNALPQTAALDRYARDAVREAVPACAFAKSPPAARDKSLRAGRH